MPSNAYLASTPKARYPGTSVAQTDVPPSILVAGKYRITQLIGRGGMGSVWEGTHTTLGTHVAVKFIESQYADSPEARSRFENEARAAARLRSKHVVEVYDHGLTEDGRPFIVMEYLRGEPLDKRLDRVGRIPAKDTARLMMQVCRALSKAHAGGIVHRDLKPENVFLVWDDEEGHDVAKVVDFGIAKFTDSSLASSSATRTGSVLGTPYYMSPEQARGLRSVDYRSDLWSVGVIAYRCLVGTLPFEGEAVGDLLVKLCTAPLPIPSQLAPDLPPGFDAWFVKALCREPEGRFSNAAELAESLGAVCGLPVRGSYATADIPIIPSYSGGPMGSYAAITPGVGAMTPGPDVLTPTYGGADRSGSNPALGGSDLNIGSTVQMGTGAPITNTPAPQQRKNAGAVVATVAAAVVVLGIGVGVLLKVTGDDKTTAPASDSKPSQSPVVASPSPAAPPSVVLAEDRAAPTPVPVSATAEVPSAAPLARGKPVPPATKPNRPPAVRPIKPGKDKPGAAVPGSDMGF